MVASTAWVAIAVAVPLLAALASLWQGRWTALIVAVLAIPGSLLANVGVVWTVFELGVHRHPVGGWGAPLGIDLHVDGLAAAFLALLALIAAVITVHMLVDPDMRALSPRRRSLFWSLWYLVWGALAAMFVSGDAFNIYVTLELATLAGVILVSFGHGTTALFASMRYLLLGTFGALSYVLGVALLYGDTGTLDLALMAERIGSGAAPVVAAGLVTVGLAVKAALVPLHVWLPPAHASAPAGVSAILSALVVKAGFYLMVRFWFGPFVQLDGATWTVLGILGAVGVVWGSLCAIRQERLKLLIAYSTVAQVGYLFLLFPLVAGGAHAAAWSGAHYLALSHAAAKAAAFLAAGNILTSQGDDRLSMIARAARHHHLSLLAFGLAGATLMGLPPSGGFLAKWLLVTAAVDTGQWWWAAVLIAGGILAAIYVYRVVRLAYVTSPAEPPGSTGPPRPPGLLPVPMVAILAALALALLSVVLGFASAMPLRLLEIGMPAVVPPEPEPGR
ncbi:MAG: oxidoreductase [Rhodospirillales bacterium]|nr:MAG: oxidoreductase [Rhodospirillales bacterium]